MNNSGCSGNGEVSYLELDSLSAEERRSLEMDLSLAVRIQQARLPDKVSCLPGWQSHFRYRPAGLIGGDFCDLFESSGKLLFLLGDVSGKGFGAALLASHLHATFRCLAEARLSVTEMMEAANRVFCRTTPAAQFATLIVGKADRDGAIEFVNAGHVPLLHIQDGAVRVEGATGVPLGMFDDACFSSRRLFLEKGQSLLLCTDGVTETHNPADEEYGMQRLRDIAARHRWARPSELIEECLSDLSNFSEGAKRTDDLALLSILKSS